MDGKKRILGLFVILFVSISQAQENKKFNPPEREPNIYTFTLPELQVDNSFIARLDSILLDRKCHYMDLILSDKNKQMRHFYLQFEKIDSLHYSIIAMLENFPAKKSIGFSIHNKYYHWFGGEIPPNMILGEKTKKQFSYKNHSTFSTTDPPLWVLKYNSQTGYIEVKEKPCY